MSLTNTYLSGGEQRVLAALDGRSLVEVRGVVEVDGLAWVVDRFGGRLWGLVLAERKTRRSRCRSRPGWVERSRI